MTIPNLKLFVFFRYRLN